MRNTIAFLAALMLCGCTIVHRHAEMPVALNQSLVLTKNEIATLEKQASSGNGGAAFRLYQYYEYVIFDLDRSREWLRVAANSGHVIAQFSLGLFLLEKHDEKTHGEAIGWLEKAAAAGYPRAKELLTQGLESQAEGQ